MRQKRTAILMSVFFLTLLLNGGLILAQEGATSEQISVPPEDEMQWVWAEIISVDTQNKKILLKYLDYDTDTEEEISIGVDDKTTYENVKSIDELKPQDTISVDYIVTAEGKNIARNISVEKPEELPTIEEETPQDIQGPVSGIQD